MVSAVERSLDSCRILELTAEQAEEFWPELEPLILRALHYDPFHTVGVNELRQQFGTGYSRVFIGADEGNQELLMATVIQLHMLGSGERVLHIVTTAGGDSSRWLPELIDAMIALGKEENCESITVAGRPGWARKLSKIGFRTDYVNMRMHI